MVPPPPSSVSAPESASWSDRVKGLLARVRTEALDRPGLYFFHGPRGEVLYVGKSVRIRNRLVTHFRSPPGGKGAELVRSATEVRWEYRTSELEALLDELRAIRRLRPRFNVQHRRERRFAWVRITGGPAPRLVATRVPAPDGRSFGPFPARRTLPDTLRELARLQGLRDCADGTPIRFADQLDLLAEPMVPACPRAELGTCPGPCASLCSQAEYRDRVERTAAFLAGRDDAPLARLQSRREAAAARRDYEGAARLRDAEAALRTLRDGIVAFGRYLEHLTFVHRVPDVAGTVRVLVLRRGRVRMAFDEPPPGSPRARALAEEIGIVARASDPPPAHLDAGEREALFLTARWFRAHPDEAAGAESLEGYRARLSRPPLAQGQGPTDTEPGTTGPVRRTSRTVNHPSARLADGPGSCASSPHEP